MKIFAAGVATETNTFSPLPTEIGDFIVQRGRGDSSGQAIKVPGFNLPDLWEPLAHVRGDVFVFSLMAWAQPSGLTARAAYESLRDEILEDLRSAVPVDIVLLMLHGAMVAQGYDDCEADLIGRVRSVVGHDAIIAVELDLHCHLGSAKLAGSDIVITYKEYPHTDINDRAKELFDLAVETRLGNIKPTMALFDCRMMGLYPTTRQPLRGFVDSMMAAENRPRVLSISFAHGFQFGDVAHAGAKILAVTDDDTSLANELAREFGMRVYGLRQRIGFDSIALPMEDALSRAMASHHTPIVIADQSDNIGAGAPGDATFALQWLLERNAEDVGLAIFYDPDVVRDAKAAGVGATLSINLGGKMGPFSGDPVRLDVSVGSIVENYVHALPQQSGESPQFFAGDVVAVRTGSIDIVIASERCQCFGPSIFKDLGIDPTKKRLLIAKSAQHFYAGFAPIAGEIIYMAAQGAVVPDPRRIRYRRLDTSAMYPWVSEPLLG